MEQVYSSRMERMGYSTLICDIFSDWENVKDEILPTDRKVGTGNGTVHVFLGKADAEFRNEFPQYYEAVEGGEDPSVKAIKVTHYFSISNVVSLIGHLCLYDYESLGGNYDNVNNILSALKEEKTDEGLLSTESLLKLSVGSSKPRPYFKQFDNEGVFAKVVRPLLLHNTAYKISFYKNQSGEYAAFWMLGFAESSDFEVDSSKKLFTPSIVEHNFPRQQIFYGAPGTGKSHEVKESTDYLPEENVFRTTFHPDSDYSTFVGAYKPKPIDGTGRKMTKVELSAELSRMKTIGVTYPCQKFAAKYWNSLKELSVAERKELLDATGFPDSMVNEFIKGMAVGEDIIAKIDSKITYAYTPQAFLKAYVRAHLTDEPVFLVIEEINRGNCAQVFGDMFQLLDRNEDGVSDYAVKPDTDIEDFLVNQLGDLYNSAEGMRLPSNLYIWATMNTSDQSLFPIDSAFKRRWDWKYMKIKNEGKDWEIDVKIKDANGEEQPVKWWDFISKVNSIIATMTSSADKQLGYFFCKADKKTEERAAIPNSENNLISADTFVSKVLFYLWNDVFKDYGFEDASLFQYTQIIDGKEIKQDLTFPDFYQEDGNDVDVQRVTDFVQKVMVWKKKTNTED